MLLRPPYLHAGDTIAIVATARKINADVLATAIQRFESWGLQVHLGKTIGAEHHQFAGSDELRMQDMQAAIDDPNVRCIMVARGGYGTVRMMDGLDWTGLLQHPKWIAGFSDVTYLHVHLNQTLGVQALHCAMPATFPTSSEAAIESIRQQLFGERQPVAIPPHSLNRYGTTKGVLIGGNLSILYSITGTRSGFNTDGKILFIEDLDEQLYHIDRMMMNLKRSGKLHALAGLVVGGMSDMKDNAVPFGMDAYEIILDHVREYDYPLCMGYPAGHILDNTALVLGAVTKLEVTATGAILS
jgi:muramoyltetrapeptide carboxypeptidase